MLRPKRLIFLLSSIALAQAACGSEPAPPPATPLLKREDLASSFPRTETFLASYLAVDTTNPPGNERRAFPLLERALAEIGLTATVAAMGPDRGDLYATLAAPKPDPGAGPLVLLHHIDVVPVERGKWSVPPFSGTKKDGRLYGRGALDIKVLGAVQLAALERLAKTKDRLRRDVIFLAVSDEEVDGRGAQLAALTLFDRWKPEYLLDEGGVSVRSFLNGADIALVATTQKRVAKLRLVAHGEAGHGSRPIPTGGPNILVEALRRIEANPPPIRVVPATARQLGRIAGIAGFPKSFLLKRLSWPGVLGLMESSVTENRNLNPLFRDTLTLTMIEAGQKDNVIPAEASAIFDVRLLPDTALEDVIRHLERAVAGLPVTFEVRHAPLAPMTESPEDDPLFAALAASVRAHEPQAIVSSWMCIGATDSRFFAPKGVRTYGFSPVFMDKEQTDSIHGHDENVTLGELEKGIVVYTEALERFLLR